VKQNRVERAFPVSDLRFGTMTRLYAPSAIPQGSLYAGTREALNWAASGLGLLASPARFSWLYTTVDAARARPPDRTQQFSAYLCGDAWRPMLAALIVGFRICCIGVDWAVAITDRCSDRNRWSGSCRSSIVPRVAVRFRPKPRHARSVVIQIGLRRERGQDRSATRVPRQRLRHARVVVHRVVCSTCKASTSRTAANRGATTATHRPWLGG